MPQIMGQIAEYTRSCSFEITQLFISLAKTSVFIAQCYSHKLNLGQAFDIAVSVSDEESKQSDYIKYQLTQRADEIVYTQHTAHTRKYTRARKEWG